MSRISKDIVISGGWDHLFADCPDNPKICERAQEKLKNTAGVSFFSEVLEFPLKNFDDILEKVLLYFADSLVEKSFCVRVKRTGTHDFVSLDLERYLGSGILQNIPSTKVDLRHPQMEVALIVKGNTVSIVKNKVPAVGGYPIGSQGKVLLLLSGGFDSGVAAQMMMAKGCKVDFLFFNLGGVSHEMGVREVAHSLWKTFSQSFPVKMYSVPFEKVIRELLTNTKHSYRGILLKRLMIRIAEKIARKHRYKAIVTGESLAQVSSQTLTNLNIISRVTDMLLLRPLLALNKLEIISRAKQIGTADFAEKMPEYCGVISKKPSADAKMRDILAEEEKFDMNILDEAFSLLSGDIAENFSDAKSQIPMIKITSSPQKNEIVIDIREPEECVELPLKVSETEILPIPFYEIEEKFPQLDQKKTFLLFCEGGILSRMHAEQLMKKGYRNVKVYDLPVKCGL